MSEFYFDHAATTPIDERVLAAMNECYRQPLGNASSTHRYGRAARQRLNKARDQVAAALGCSPHELVFTSGGTESNALAIRGVMELALERGRNHIITSAIEHHAVLKVCEQLAKSGRIELTVLPVDSYGLVKPDQVERALTPNTALVSIMYANNETGTIQPIQQIGSLVAERDREVLFHVDAVQALGKLALDVQSLPVDLISFSAHKINGPVGVGALYIRSKSKLAPQQLGGSQERNRRAGTENVAGIVGFATAVELATQQLADNAAQWRKLKEQWFTALQQVAPVHRHGHPDPDVQLPHILNVSLLGYSTETLLMKLDLVGIAASGGSACSAGSLAPSHVLTAMNVSAEALHSAIRFSFGHGNTALQLTEASQLVATIFSPRRIR